MSQSIKQIQEKKWINLAGVEDRNNWGQLEVSLESLLKHPAIVSKLQAIRAETLESLKYNIVGLFPVNRIHKMSQEEIIELLHSFIDKKIEAENPSKGENTK